jgi:hypothetical protein
MVKDTSCQSKELQAKALAIKKSAITVYVMQLRGIKELSSRNFSGMHNCYILNMLLLTQ